MAVNANVVTKGRLVPMLFHALIRAAKKGRKKDQWRAAIVLANVKMASKGQNAVMLLLVRTLAKTKACRLDPRPTTTAGATVHLASRVRLAAKKYLAVASVQMAAIQPVALLLAIVGAPV